MPVLKNPRWEAFARAVALRGYGHSEAYRSIGGRSQTNVKKEAYIIARRPEVKARIRELQDDAKKALIERQLYDRETVMKGLLENIHNAHHGTVATYQGKVVYMTDEHGQVVHDEAGQPIPVHKPDFQAINRGWELLGYELGMFPKQTKLDVSRRDSFDAMTVEEILGQAQQHLMDLGWDVGVDDLLVLVKKAEQIAAEEVIDVGESESEPPSAD